MPNTTLYPPIEMSLYFGTALEGLVVGGLVAVLTCIAVAAFALAIHSIMRARG